MGPDEGADPGFLFSFKMTLVAETTASNSTRGDSNRVNVSHSAHDFQNFSQRVCACAHTSDTVLMCVWCPDMTLLLFIQHSSLRTLIVQIFPTTPADVIVYYLRINVFGPVIVGAHSKYIYWTFLLAFRVFCCGFFF